MARAAVFSTPTTLYHPAEGPRVFGAGEQDPGNAWFDKPGGDAVGAATTETALKDLMKAQDQNEAMGRQLASAQHDAAQAGRREAEAVAALGEANQRATDAELAHGAAQEIASQLTRERDEALAAADTLRSRVASLEADMEAATAPRARVKAA